jgi:hypothetical protein
MTVAIHKLRGPKTTRLALKTLIRPPAIKRKTERFVKKAIGPVPPKM